MSAQASVNATVLLGMGSHPQQPARELSAAEDSRPPWRSEDCHGAMCGSRLEMGSGSGPTERPGIH